MSKANQRWVWRQAFSDSHIYLISPPKIELEHFAAKLETALETGKIALFQLRLKDISDEEIIKNSKKLLEICQKYQVPFVLNDRLDLALEIGANGVHLGAEDGNIKEARAKTAANFIIGASCYDSKEIIEKAAAEGANYVSMGAFFDSKTKKSRGKPTLELLKWCHETIPVANICIGGINDKNHKELFENGADFIAIISYIWDHEKGVKFAIESLS